MSGRNDIRKVIKPPVFVLNRSQELFYSQFSLPVVVIDDIDKHLSSMCALCVCTVCVYCVCELRVCTACVYCVCVSAFLLSLSLACTGCDAREIIEEFKKSNSLQLRCFTS